MEVFWGMLMREIWWLTKKVGVGSWVRLSKRCVSGLLLCSLICGVAALAQTGGEGAIEGTVADPTGAVIPNATVIATNKATNVSTTRTASSGGLYSTGPIIPGTYSIKVTAAGFQTYTQDNLVVDGLKTTGLNIALPIGSADQTVTVSEAPPQLETTNATLGGVMENATYSNLPLQMNGQQRDATAFATLIPGAQAGARAPIIAGTGNYLAEVYLDGLPLTTSNQQGDNRVISNGLNVDAVEQFQVVTSAPPAEYQGAGLINFTMKSGGDQYHGSAADFIRNTIFDTYPYLAKIPVKNADGTTSIPAKPVEHQNEFAATFGGPIPFTHKKGFFFASYDRYHSRNGVNPLYMTVPTLKMRAGDFSELLSKDPKTGATVGQIYDPTSQAACTANSTTGPCRYQYGYGPGAGKGAAGNPIATGAPVNVIPASQISPIAQYFQKFLPAPTTSDRERNFLGGVPTGFDNWSIDSRVDFDLTDKQRISFVMALGTRKNVPYTLGSTTSQLPAPYLNGSIATIKPTIFDVEHTYQISSNIVNQFKYGFTRFAQPVQSVTDGVTDYEATAGGITNLPPGQASTEFPGASFGTTALFGTVQDPWTGNGASTATQFTIPNAFTLVDNLGYTKGKHSITAGIQIQWLQDNVSPLSGPSGILTLPYNANSTANFSGNALLTTTTGYSYASYLLGAVGGSPSIAIQAFSETGGRYRPISPYVQDDWKVTPKLTLNLGLRYDYFPPFHEVLDRWSYLDPNATNPATGNKGALRFAGNRGADISCNCRTPVQTWWKNFGPRLGFAYAADDKTVFRGAFAISYSRAGGVGGRAGAGNGTGQLGFTVNAVAPAETTSGAAAGPSFYLNNNPGFASQNTAFGGPNFTLPQPATPGASSVSLDTGNYLNSTGGFVTASGAPGYADPYLSGRAPEFEFFNFGIQRAVTNNITIGVNYAGSESHFVLPGASNARGYWSNQLDPKYLAQLGPLSDTANAKSPLLNAPATPANMAKAQVAGLNVPAGFAAAAAKNANASIAQMLVAFPQYSGVTDTWGQNVGNISYNSLQITLNQRAWHGLGYTVNYTYSKNIGDDGTFRSGFDLPASATSNGQAYHMNRIERSWTTTANPQSLAAFGVWDMPFGKGHLGGDNFLVRALASGWQLSSIYTYRSGTPLAITYGGCTSPKLGQCMPDVNTASPDYISQNARINGSWGHAPGGDRAATLSAGRYIDSNAFAAPGNLFQPGGTTASSINLIGTAPRTRPLNLVAPSTQNLDASLRRSFPLFTERVKATVEVDCLNVAHKHTFGSINTAWGSSTFGSVGSAPGNRDFQLAGRINF